MIDSELPSDREETVQRSPKVSVAFATSTTEVASCTLTSTTFSRHFMCWWTISFPLAGVRAGAQGSATPSSSRSRSRRSCCAALPSGAFCAWPAGACRTLFPYIPKQSGYNKRLRRPQPLILIGRPERAWAQAPMGRSLSYGRTCLRRFGDCAGELRALVDTELAEEHLLRRARPAPRRFACGPARRSRAARPAHVWGTLRRPSNRTSRMRSLADRGRRFYGRDWVAAQSA